jgi:acyl-CoA dehydrogenase
MSAAHVPLHETSFLDWPFFETRHREIATRLDTWAASALADLDHDDVDGTCRTVVQRLGADGWLQHTAPDPEDATAKVDVRTIALMRETLARHHGLADFAFAMQGLGMGPVTLFGTEAQKQRWLSQTRAGRAISAFALSEPASGSDVARMTTTATRSRDGYVIDGEKTWISNGGIADIYVVFARTGGAPGAKGISAFLVPATTPGLTIAERIDVSAPHPLARLRFEGCQVSADALIGAEGDGFRIAMATLDVFRPTVGAAALGFARKAFQLSLQRVGERELFGAPMSELQLVQGHLADMAVAIDTSALLVYRAAWAKDRGADRITREAAMAKLHATESAQAVVDAAVQLHGGDGVRRGGPLEELYRDVRALRIYEGASDVQKVVLARQALAGRAPAGRHNSR